MSDSELEPGEYQHANSGTKERSARSVSPAGSRGSKRSPSPRRRSYSRSRSRGSRSRSRSREYHRRRSPKRNSHGRRSPSYERRYSRKRSYSRSRSRSRSYGSSSPLSGRKRHIGDRMNPPSGKCLGVFGLSLYTTESDLQDVFSRYGYIDKCNIVMDQKTGRSRGVGFVYYENVDDAVEAKDRANGMDLDGRKIRVDFSITKRAHTPTPGMYVGRPAPNYNNGPPRGRYDDRDRRYDDRYDRRYDDHRDRGYNRRSPSPHYRRRSPSPYRDRRY